MFDLEKSIREWKKSFRRNEAFEDGMIADFESHLRDLIDALKEAGMPEEEAFHEAAVRVGKADILASEYGKVREYRLDLQSPLRLSRFMPALGWNYFKVAVRKFKRQKSYSFINFAGLCVGILCSLSIMLSIEYELSYDRQYKNAKDIYRIITQWPQQFMGTDKITWTSSLLAPALKDHFPEVANASRIEERSQGVSLSFGNRTFSEEKFYFVDRDFLSMFSFSLLQGQQETALSNPLSVIISEDMAGKYFDGENPVGKILRYNNKRDFQITGVFQNVPKNTHFRYDFLASFQSLEVLEGENAVYMNRWSSLNYQTYVQLNKGTDPLAFEKILGDYLLTNTPEDMKDYRYFLQPLIKIHLGGNIPGELAQNSQMKYIFIYSAVALLVILITCFNYINLSTARFSMRAAEINIRKVIGANRKQLIQQFFGETILTTISASIIAFLLFLLALPYFNKLTGADFDFSLLKHGSVLASVMGLICLVGLLSASYPALHITALRSSQFTKPGTIEGLAKRGNSRNLLVVIQFVISTALSISALMVHRQVKFVMAENFGQLSRSIITFQVSDDNVEMRNGIDVFKRALLKESTIENVAVSSWPPTNIRSGNNASWEGMEKKEGALFHNLMVDYDFFDLYDIPVIQGRNFSRDFPSDLTQAYIINETAVRLMGVEDPIGSRFAVGSQEGIIIGVVSDFHFVPIHQRIKPLAVRLNPQSQIYMSIKINPSHIVRTIQTIKNEWKKISPGFAFKYSFINDEVDALYRSEQKLSNSVTLFTCMALFLANLGLFGLTLFSVERRVKEIGIRKVCGAMILNIVLLLSRDFYKSICIANLIALPLAYIVLNRWLQGFAYRTNMSLGIFIFSSILSFALAGLPVFFRAVKAAMANPVDSLRYE